MTANRNLEAAPAKLSLVQSEATLTSRFKLTPANRTEGTAQLASCLVLVAPSGMTADEREEWLKAARLTLSGIPGDLLARGCQAARETCRFASEIIPAILAETKLEWDRRKRNLAIERAQFENRHAPRIEQQPPEYVSADEVRALIRNIGKAA